MSENSCKHTVMNGGINFVSAQTVETPQVKQICLNILNILIVYWSKNYSIPGTIFETTCTKKAIVK